ncbi:hypothetical protein BJG93_34695 (plasmid) [Paraburkholderia sprentiae WSM5005]|uniref:Uncharacterized protein n=1 Tax=Paraburkholderia sprentiae WSM5005 TaxID=754502 RepID=A0ACA8AX28_9BURK|nr:hypothetical protein [Paraburkholderia sprentiae]APA90263.1 hypothetical protein BJG93_34695 [Paraburkholderia sprentiae WSM5005]
MNTTEHVPTRDPLKEPPLVRALLRARYYLTIHDGMTVTAEGKSWPLDFGFLLAEIDAALQGADYDTTQPMLAPIRPEELGEAEDLDDAGDVDDEDDDDA